MSTKKLGATVQMIKKKLFRTKNVQIDNLLVNSKKKPFLIGLSLLIQIAQVVKNFNFNN
jgi:hypothetical protein